MLSIARTFLITNKPLKRLFPIQWQKQFSLHNLSVLLNCGRKSNRKRKTTLNTATIYTQLYHLKSISLKVPLPDYLSIAYRFPSSKFISIKVNKKLHVIIYQVIWKKSWVFSIFSFRFCDAEQKTEQKEIRLLRLNLNAKKNPKEFHSGNCSNLNQIQMNRQA
jgi:hypothetical protein